MLQTAKPLKPVSSSTTLEISMVNQLLRLPLHLSPPLSPSPLNLLTVLLLHTLLSTMRSPLAVWAGMTPNQLSPPANPLLKDRAPLVVPTAPRVFTAF